MVEQVTGKIEKAVEIIQGTTGKEHPAANENVLKAVKEWAKDAKASGFTTHGTDLLDVANGICGVPASNNAGVNKDCKDLQR